MSEVLPRILGDYELLELLSGGALTNTYFARRDVVDADGTARRELVSFKALRRFSDVAPERAALMREAELEERCTHPGVVRVVDRGTVSSPLGGRECFIARSYVPGFALSELLVDARGERCAFPRAVVVALGSALLSVLRAVHEAGADDGRVLGLIHRDVTPSNVLLGLDGEVYLTDFGLAHAPGAWGLLPDDEVAQGTPRYVTPEAARGEQPDMRSDLFQLALVLLELLGHGVRGASVSLAGIVEEDLRELPALTSLETGPLGSLLRRALEADPARRFATASAMLTALRQVSESDAPPQAEQLRLWLEREFSARVAAERARVERALGA